MYACITQRSVPTAGAACCDIPDVSPRKGTPRARQQVKTGGPDVQTRAWPMDMDARVPIQIDMNEVTCGGPFKSLALACRLKATKNPFRVCSIGAHHDSPSQWPSSQLLTYACTGMGSNVFTFLPAAAIWLLACMPCLVSTHFARKVHLLPFFFYRYDVPSIYVGALYCSTGQSEHARCCLLLLKKGLKRDRRTGKKKVSDGQRVHNWADGWPARRLTPREDA